MRKKALIRLSLFSFSIAFGVGALMPVPSLAMTVYDPWNYSQNLLIAMRELESIENQIRQLTNDAQMLLRMDKHLQRLENSVAGDLLSGLQDMRALMEKADSLISSVEETEQILKTLYAATETQERSGSSAFEERQSIENARKRWSLALSSYKQSLSQHAHLENQIRQDGDLLQALLEKSQNAEGSLQAQQITNELLGLQIKQDLQMQRLLTGQSQAGDLQAARHLSEEEEARQRFKLFMGERKPPPGQRN